MNIKNIYALTLSILVSLYSYSQETIVLQPDASLGKDALLHGLISEINVNRGDNPQLPASAWTFHGIPGEVRSVFEFDLSAIPDGATIDSAFLSLYAWASDTGLGYHSTLSGSNECWLQRVTSSWDENTVTWQNQPTTTTTHQVAFEASTSATQNYLNIDVANLVQDMVDNPSSSFGFMLKLQNETHYRNMNFASSDHSNINMHPKLVITYSPSLSVHDINKKEIEFNLYPNPVSNFLKIDLSNSFKTITSIEIINSLGQIIERKSDIQSVLTINVSNYAKGLYFIKVNSINTSSIKKVIIY